MPPQKTQVVIDYKAEMRDQAYDYDNKREVGEVIHNKAQRLQALGSVASV